MTSFSWSRTCFKADLSHNTKIQSHIFAYNFPIPDQNHTPPTQTQKVCLQEGNLMFYVIEVENMDDEVSLVRFISTFSQYKTLKAIKLHCHPSALSWSPFKAAVNQEGVINGYDSSSHHSPSWTITSCRSVCQYFPSAANQDALHWHRPRFRRPLDATSPPLTILFLPSSHLYIFNRHVSCPRGAKKKKV